MDTIKKDELERYLRARMEEVTNPVIFIYGYETRPGAEARLSELKYLARKFGFLALYDDIARAQKPIREWIDNQRKRGLPVY